MAGVSRLQYTPDIRLVRVMCSGRVDLKFVLRAFLNGMDGVFVGACRLGECNYTTHGNYHALNMVLLCKKLMEHAGLEPERLKIEFMSSGDGMFFSQVVDEFSQKVKALGPGAKNDKPKSKLAEIAKLVPYIKMMKNEKLGIPLLNADEYENYFTGDEIDRLLGDVVSYRIDPEKCRACMICLKRCPAEAVVGGKKQIHVIDQDKCIKCGVCFESCPPRFGAVRKNPDAVSPSAAE